MGGTIAPSGCMPVPAVPSVAGSIGGGGPPGVIGGAPPGVIGGGGPPGVIGGGPPGIVGGGPPGIVGGGPLGQATPPGGDLTTAIAALQGALNQLSAVLSAMSGAGQLTGGGPAGAPSSGCGCGGGDPSQYMRGAHGAPDAPPPTSPGDDPGGSVRDRIVKAARAELAKGVKEDAGKDNDKAGNIKRYRSAVTGPGEDPNAAEPWCADFASYVWKVAGTPFGRNGQGEDHTKAMIDWAKQQGRYHPRSSADPKPGDLVMIDWGGGQSVDHVAVVVEVKDGRVHTIGGNESNSLKSASYSRNDPKMMGFITPGTE